MSKTVRFWYAAFVLSLVFLVAAGVVASDLADAPPKSAAAGAIAAACSIPVGASLGVLFITATRRNRLLRKYGSLVRMDTGLMLTRKSEFCLPKSWDFWVWSVLGAAVTALGAFGGLGPGGNS